jgi:pantetheine-phosphate adenylyltransferase
MTKVVFPGSFDPVTVGHLSIIERACQLFSEVHVAIAEKPSSSKSVLWSIDERHALMGLAVAHLKQVKIHRFSGLLVEFLKSVDIPVIVRGVRSAVDWNFESELFQVHKILWPSIEMVCLRSNPQYDAVSSTYVREIFRYKGDISSLVPPQCLKLIEEKHV